MEPNIWGPGAWTFLHSITLNYPDNPSNEQKKIYSDFFYMLPKILPCEICKKHLTKHINDSPINFHLNSKESITKWLYAIHNKTNSSLGKSIITYKEFIDIYDKMYSNKDESITYYKKKKNIQRYIIYILILTLLGLCSYYFIKHKIN